MIYLSMIDRYGSVLRVEYITRLGIDGCSDCPWTKKHLPNGRSKRGAVLLSEMVPLQIVAWVPAPAPARLGLAQNLHSSGSLEPENSSSNSSLEPRQEPGEEIPIVIFENSLLHSSYAVRPLRYLKVLSKVDY